MAATYRYRGLELLRGYPEALRGRNVILVGPRRSGKDRVATAWAQRYPEYTVLPPACVHNEPPAAGPWITTFCPEYLLEDKLTCGGLPERWRTAAVCLCAMTHACRLWHSLYDGFILPAQWNAEMCGIQVDEGRYLPGSLGDRTRYLTERDVVQLVARTEESLRKRGPDYFRWRDAPGPTEEKEAIISVFQASLDGVYSERFALFMALLPTLVRRGHKVALLHKQTETKLPWKADSSDWLIASVNGFPIFHLSPGDLSGVAEFVTEVPTHSHEAQVHVWKETDKLTELSMLLYWAQ